MANPPTVHASYNGGFIFLAYLVSFIGCVTSLELLHRRTSRRGAINWYLLIASSVSMGGIGIWCMHFIGNRAIQLDSDNGQIGYSSGFTAISFFLPIIVLLAAFYLLAVTSSKSGGYFLAISGILTGTAVCGMHYVGDFGIVNYSCRYRVANVVGAGFIAVVASFVALSVFFRLQETWTHNWWKRGLCGAILAGAVSGMHWTAAVGTSYQPKGTAHLQSTLMSRIQTVIVCTVLSLATCIVLLGITFLANLRRQQSRKRAHQLVLAGAYFDEAGRVMVTPQGLLPAQRITNSYVEKTFGDGGLTNTHPAFLWAFRASHNWTALKDLLPGVKQHLENDPIASLYYPGIGKPRRHYPPLVEDFAVTFKELFSVAADSLASHLNQPLDRLGVLFEEPVSTGTVSGTNTARLSRCSRKSSSTFSQEDLEKGGANSFSGKGQILFVVRQLDKYEVEKLAAHGYRFAAIPQIADLASKNMQIPPEDIYKYLDRMKDYSVTGNHLEPGIHLAAFVLRPKINNGFDVLVPSKTKTQLPTVALPFQALTTWQLMMLENFNNRRVADVLQELLIKTDYTQDEQDFRQQLYWAVNKLVELIHAPSFLAQAKFSAKPLQVPCRSSTAEGGEEKQCILLSFRMITSIYDQPPRDQLTYMPLKFFNAQQQALDRVACYNAFVRDAREEFAHCRESGQGRASLKRLTKSMEKRLSFSKSKPPPSPTTPSSSMSLEIGRGDVRESHDSKWPMESERDHMEARVRDFGSLSSVELVEVSTPKEHAGGGGTTETGESRVGTGRRGQAPPTFVDEIYKLFLVE